MNFSGEVSPNALLTGCEIHKGTRAVERNLEAVMQVYDSVRTSYGPLGLDKMCVDASGTVMVTNDGATILQNMIVEDPVAKMMVNLAIEQDKEVGDGTTTVVLLAANLVKFGAQLIKEGVHPSTVVSGYRIAFNEIIKYVKNDIATKIDSDNSVCGDVITAAIATSISSKILSHERHIFVEIVKAAVERVKTDSKYVLENIRILKALGGSLRDCECVESFLMNCTPASPLMPQTVSAPKVLCLDFSLQKERLPLTVSINVSDAEKMEQIRREEIEIAKRRCQAIIDSGATVVLTTGGIDEIYTKMFTDHNMVAVKRCSKEDLVVLAEALGTEVKSSLFSLGNEYEIDNLGMCKRYELRSVGDSRIIAFSGARAKATVSILLRGPNTQLLEETHRSLNDALQVAKRTLELRSIVPGGGAVEIALSFLLEEFTRRVGCREHVAIHRFSAALQEIPGILAANAGLDADSVVSELMRRQYEVFKSGQKGLFLGLDVMTGKVQDNIAAGIIEPAIYKLKVLKAATEAAISVLRIEEIMILPEKK